MHRNKPERFSIRLLLIYALLGSLLPGRVTVQASSASAEPVNALTFPTQEDLASLRPQLPDDPVVAVQVLVETIFGVDELKAQAAVGSWCARPVCRWLASFRLRVAFKMCLLFTRKNCLHWVGRQVNLL